MINILLESYDITLPWLSEELEKYLKPTCKVSIVAFSFRDSQIKNLEEWNKLYSKENGSYYKGIVNPLIFYGIKEENITFVNYFTDNEITAKEKIENSDVIYFLGGLPDKMMDRINEFELYDTILNYKGVIMGVSAGALIQLAEYHLSPDKDYPKLVYFNGFPFINDFYLEVHYESTEEQNDAIKNVMATRNKTVYATLSCQGAIIVDNGKLKLLGQVKKLN